MKSIFYLLFHKPCTMDDCIDLSGRKKLNIVRVTLETEERVTDLYIIRRFLAVCLWDFKEEPITVTHALGGCFSFQNEKKQRQNIIKVNNRVHEIIDKLEHHAIRVSGDNLTFDYSLVF
jgi:hypothetical protein